MTTRYTQEQIEDVAGLLRAAKEKFGEEDVAVIGTLAYSFSILFAADNPIECDVCGSPEGTSIQCPYNDEHLFAGGFDPAQFLAACGLEPARPYSTSMLIRQEGEPGTGKTTGG